MGLCVGVGVGVGRWCVHARSRWWSGVWGGRCREAPACFGSMHPAVKYIVCVLETDPVEGACC